MTPGLIVNAVFAWYILDGNKITAATAFTVVSIFNVLQVNFPLYPLGTPAKRSQNDLHDHRIREQH